MTSAKRKYWDYAIENERITNSRSEVQMDAFIRGVKAGIEAYSTYKDGKQLVGCMEEEKNDVFKEIDEIVRRQGPVN